MDQTLPQDTDSAAMLVMAASLFAEPGALRADAPSLESDARQAAEDAGHEPAYEAVRVMLALFPELAPEPEMAPDGPGLH